MEKTLFKTSIDLTCKINKTGAFKKAVADYLVTEVAEPSNVSDFDKIAPLKELILRQPDLLYVVSTFVSQGANKNFDGFLRPTLARIFETAKNKFVDYEHDVTATKSDVNPDKYKIVGHIYDSCLATQETGTLIPNYEIYFDNDGKLFSKDSPFRNQGLDVVVAWVLYQFEYPELADMIVEKFLDGDNGKFGVSMEVLFTDYKYRVGEFDPNEEFEYDANTVGKIEGRKGTELGEELKPYWEKRKLYKGQPVTRILGGQIFFSGMAITSNRAAGRSMNQAIASIEDVEKTEENKEFIALLTAVASRNKDLDLSTCKIVDGEPDCDCLENAIAAELNSISIDMEKLKAFLENKKLGLVTTSEKKPGEVAVAEEEDEDLLNHLDSANDSLKQAQLYLQNLYENNMDGDFSTEEMMESLEEIEHILQKTRAMCLKEKIIY